jgi:hypothetical protein
MKKSTGKANEAARLLGKRSASVRRREWGKKEFLRRMREWGKLGGRPKGSGKKKSKRGES